MSGKTHPHEKHLLEYYKKILSREHCEREAAWVKKEYPGSAHVLLPALRDMWQKLD